MNIEREEKMKRLIIILIAFILTAIVYYAGYKRLFNKASTYILFTTNKTVNDKRVHVATFDTDYESANRADCWETAKFFQYEVGTEAKFWCEKER